MEFEYVPNCQWEGATRYCPGTEIPWYDQPWLMPSVAIAALLVLCVIAVRLTRR